MIGDQELQHFGKPFSWALAADALHADARAFAEEEDLVREEFGFREPGLAAKRDEPLAEPALELLDDSARRDKTASVAVGSSVAIDIEPFGQMAICPSRRTSGESAINGSRSRQVRTRRFPRTFPTG